MNVQKTGAAESAYRYIVNTVHVHLAVSRLNKLVTGMIKSDGSITAVMNPSN